MHAISIWKDETCVDQVNSNKDVQAIACKYLLINTEIYVFPDLKSIGICNIKSICCNEDICMAVSEEGMLLGWGNNQSGLLGPSRTVIVQPIRLERLSNIEKVSLAKSHAAALDENGALFTWGSSDFGKLGYTKDTWQIYPEYVRSSKIFKSTQIFCGENFTSILSDGGFLHIYGEIGYIHDQTVKRVENHIQTGRSYSHPELDNYCAIQLIGGKNFISVLIDSGEVYAFDECMDLVRLPTSTYISTIVANDHYIWGISGRLITSWKAPEDKPSKGCSISNWEANLYETNSNFQAFSTSNSFITISETDSLTMKSIQKILPYKRSDYTRKLIEHALESPKLSLKKQSRVSVQGYENLERLYPNGEYQTIEKIMKCRIEHNKRKTLNAAFVEKVNPVIKHGFLKIKEYSWAIQVYENAMAVANLSNILLLIIKKINSRDQALLFQKFRYALGRAYTQENKKELSLLKFWGIMQKYYYSSVSDIYSVIVEFSRDRFIRSFLIKVRELYRTRLQMIFQNWKKILSLKNQRINITKSFSKNSEILIKLDFSFIPKCIDEENSAEMRTPFHTNHNTLTNPMLLYSIDTNMHQSSASSPNEVRNSSSFYRKIISPTQKGSKFSRASLTRYYHGEVISYQSYLIKKKLDEKAKRSIKFETSKIKNRTSVSPPVRVSTILKNNKPPWRPAPALTGKNSTKNRIKMPSKGNESYLNLRNISPKDNLESKFKEASNSHSYQSSPSFISLRYKSPNSFSNISASEIALNISVSATLLKRFISKKQALIFESSFFGIKNWNKNLYKLPAPTPDDTPTITNIPDFVSLIGDSWQLGMISIASERLERFMKKNARRKFWTGFKNY